MKRLLWYVIIFVLWTAILFIVLQQQFSYGSPKVLANTAKQTLQSVSRIFFKTVKNGTRTSSRESTPVLDVSKTILQSVELPLCPAGTKLVGPLYVNQTFLNWEQLQRDIPLVQHGGVVQPSQCKAQQQVTVVVPYRNRESHLRLLLRQLFPILRRQNLHARIVVVEQLEPLKFNRAMLMNIGFTEALKIDPNTTCFVFHDVDLLPEDDMHPYSCSLQPRHLSVAVDKFDYKLQNATLFGGANAIPTDVFRAVNGFSNTYFGWGGEDDDMYSRLMQSGYQIERSPSDVARYTMLKHDNEKGNEPNDLRMKQLDQWSLRWSRDGLSSMGGAYKVVSLERLPLFTHVKVILDPIAINKTLQLENIDEEK